MNPQSIEVEIDAAGQVHARDPRVSIPAGPALLTPLGASRASSQPGSAPARADDWHALVGMLRASPNWLEEPQQIQDRLRDEWR